VKIKVFFTAIFGAAQASKVEVEARMKRACMAKQAIERTLSNNGFVHTLMREDVPVGTLEWGIVQGMTSLDFLYVTLQLRKHGYATALINEVLEAIKARRIESANVCMCPNEKTDDKIDGEIRYLDGDRASGQALRLFKRNGFLLAGEGVMQRNLPSF
jgi:GNAT superfamily N-acetyltransferase